MEMEKALKIFPIATIITKNQHIKNIMPLTVAK